MGEQLTPGPIRARSVILENKLEILLLASCALLIAALLTARRSVLSRKLGVLVASAACGWGLLSVLLAASHYFTGAGITVAVVYHLEYGLQGAGFGEYWRELLLALGLLVVGVALAFWLAIGKRGDVKPTRVNRGAVTMVLILASLVMHPAATGLAGVYAARWGWLGTPSTGPGVRYLEPVLHVAEAKPPNLVFIYLESLERTYFDDAVFPDLVPHLKRLEATGISFTDVRQVLGSEFTMGGIVASQCGVPLLTAADGNSMSAVDQFMPAARCMGDLLQGQSYQLSYLGGAPLQFAGKGAFHRNHGFARVSGLAELQAERPSPLPRSSWGLYDDDLFEIVRGEVQRLGGRGGPFGVFALSLDTHHPRGHATPSCSNLRYGDGSDTMLNAVHCADYLVGQLIKQLRSDPSGKDLMIVIASDHLAMRNSQFERLQTLQRRNLLLLLPPGNPPGEQIERPASTLDVGATVLAAMGLRTVGLGYGRDIRGPAPNLIESSTSPNGFLTAQGNQLASLWRYPSVAEGLLVDPIERAAHIGARQLSLPTLLWLDNNLQVREAIFDREQPERLTGYLSKLPDGAPYVLLDRCPGAVDLGIQIGDVEERCRKTCLFAGRTAHLRSVAIPICESTELSGATLAALVHGGLRLDLESTRKWRSRLDRVLVSAASDQHQVEARENAGKRTWEVRSSGFGAGKSTLRSLPSSSDHLLTIQHRGLSIFALDDDSAPRLIANVDTCETLRPSDSSGTAAVSLTKMANGLDNAATRLLVIAHDSAFCGDRALLERFFADSGLEAWRELSFRQPYVALIDHQQPGREWLGSKERSLLVTLN